jgi:subfamily B ATP-binding cassette protein MsbA
VTPNLLAAFPLFGLNKSRIALFAMLSVGAALLEGFGMAMFLPVLEYVEKGRDLGLLQANSEMWRRLLKAYAMLGVEANLATLLAAAVGLMLLRVVVIYARQTYIGWLRQHIQHSIRSALFAAYMAMDYGSFIRLSSGSMINVLTTETQYAAGSFAALFALFANGVVVAGFVVILLWLSWPLTLLAVVFLGLSGLAVGYYVRNTRSNSHVASDANRRFSSLALERLGAFRLIKLTTQGPREALRVRAASDEVRRQFYWLARAGASVDLIMEPMALLSGGVILYVAVSNLGLSLAEVGIFVMILLRLLPLAKETMKSRQTFHASAGSLAAVIGGHANALAQREAGGGQRQFDGLRQAIRFEQVSFSHPGSQVYALQDISLEIPAGRVTALVGPSGAGKSTLAELIPALRRPLEGRVLYDGQDGAEFDVASLRRRIAFVSQDAAILDDTVAKNLRFVRPEATDDQLWNALDGAQAAGFVRAMDAGLQTILGERGTRLSGGQKQRLSLARALLQESSILVLDEPTSALDSETEEGIQRALAELRTQGRVTIVIIAHRLSTIRDADQIVVLMDGRIVEQGSHEQLMISEDWYARISGIQIEPGS